MKSQIKRLIQEQNSKEDGLLIKMDLEQFVEKIFANAKILCILDEGQLAGFIAYYKNDPNKIIGYLTMIVVNKVHQSKGIGKQLMDSFIFDLKNGGYQVANLEVLKTNKKALSMYQQYGFEIKEDRDELWMMELRLV